MRLTRAFGLLVLALLAAVGASALAGLYALHRQDRALDHVMHVDSRRLLVITDVRRRFRAMVVQEDEQILQPDASLCQAIERTSAAVRIELIEKLDAYKALMPDADRPAAEGLESAFARWVALHARVVELVRADQRTQAYAVAETHRADPLSWEDAIAGLVAANELRLDDQVAEAGRMYRAGRDVLVIASLGSLLFALTIGSVVFRRIRQTVADLLATKASLEHTVENRTRALQARERSMRLVLDNVGQGFLLVERDGTLAEQRSAIVERWFGPVAPGAQWWAYLFAEGDRLELARLGWEAIVDDLLPIEVNLAQLPTELERAGRFYTVSYRPIHGAGELAGRVLLVLTDITDVRVVERAQRHDREQVAVLTLALRDPDGFREFFAEACGLVDAIASSTGDTPRNVHTLKGNCAVYEVHSVSEACHAVEDRIADEGAPASADERARIVGIWGAFASWVRELWTVDAKAIVVDRAEYDAVVDWVHDGQPARTVERRMRTWSRERMDSRFARIARHVRAFSVGLGKTVDVTIDASDLRLDSGRWSAFWAAFVHVVRNAVDHGIEPPDERLRLGKAPHGTVALRAALEGDELVISLSDDGRGIDWEIVRQRAAALGLPVATPAELEEALFADGLSTRMEVTEVSGRGIGLGAVRAAVASLGGRIRLTTAPGAGSTWDFRFRRGYESVTTPNFLRTKRAGVGSGPPAATR